LKNRTSRPRCHPVHGFLAALLLLAAPAAASDYQVILNEIHYHPADPEAAKLEFVELHNLSAADVDLGGWQFTEGIDFTFPAGTVIRAGEYLVVSPDPQRAREIYGLSAAAGPYSGQLDNGGEVVALVNAEGRAVSRVHYEDGGVWPALADGLGPSLEFTGSDTGNDLASRWAASLVLGGTPGAPSSRAGSTADRLVPGVVNEVRPSGGPGDPGFIELFNPTGATLTLDGFHIRLGGGESFLIPGGTSIAVGAFRTFGDAALGFPVPSREDACLLLEPDGATIADSLAVARALPGQSTGRFPDGDEDVFVLAPPTSGAANVHSLDSPVVINEIHFHPGHVPPAGACLIRCSDAEQWIEVWNRSGAEVDVGGWTLTKAVDFTFPPGTRIPAGQGLVIAANIAAFQARNPGVTNVVGGWLRRLSHGSDTINLRDRLGNRVDHVKYGDGGPRNDQEPLDGADDGTFRSSLWPTGADGSGRTLELVNPALGNEWGLAWRASLAPGGTPGAPNSVLDASPDPVVGDVRHSPLVPRSTSQVVVTCSIEGLEPISTAILEWSRDGTPLQQAPLRDNGAAPDAEAGDGVYSAAIPPQPDDTVVRFRVIAIDAAGGTTTLPLAPDVPPYPGFQGPYFLYEVDNSSPPANGQPVYRIIMLEADLDELQDRELTSDVLLPATLIAEDEVRYVAGVRFRGETSRREPNRSYRVELPAEDAFDGLDDLNLNGSNGGAMLGVSNAREILATDLFRRAGAPYPQTFAINMHFPGEVDDDFDTRYARKENFDDEFLHRFFGGSDGGNFYRALNPEGVGNPSGDLQYLGPDEELYRPLYEKRSNEEEDDYSDLIELTRTLDPASTPDEIFADELDLLIDARQWAQFFAIQALLSNTDGGIWNNNGEDYFLYHVPSTSTRSDAGKFILLAWDLEEVFGSANERLFLPQLPAVRRFLTHPRFARLYYDELDLLRSGPFSRPEMRLRFDFVDAMYPADDVFNIVDPIDTYVTSRIGFIDRTIPGGIVAGPAGPTAGTPVISPGDTWRFFRGEAPPSLNPVAWTARTFNDASWETGPTGIGYGDFDDATVLEDMEDSYTTVFTRGRFQVEDPARVTGLTLTIFYDDAFVAYVNGVEVARSDNAPGSPGDPVLFDDTATNTHEADEEETFDIAIGGINLIAGTNVLAVAVLNEQPGSSDLSFIPTLSVSTAASGAIAGGCGGPIYATGSPITLSGTAYPAGALSVTVNGLLAQSSYITSGAGPYGITWSAAVDLVPGANTVTIRTHDGEEGLGAVVSTETVTVQRLAGSFTQVGGSLAGNPTWNAAGGPYRMVQDVDVPAGSTLTIEPGTVVLANDGAAIRVGGRLVVNGSEAAPVLLGAFSCGRPWDGILLEDTGTGAADPGHVIRHATIQFATSADGAAGILNVTGSKVLVEGSVFRNLQENAIDGVDSRVEIRDTLFEQIFEGVHCATSTVIILDSTFRDMIGDNDAIDFDGDMGERSQIARCLIEGSSDDGIDLALASVDVQDNVFRAVADKAISLEGNGALGPPTLTGNLIVGCGTGMALKDGVTIVDGAHNTITECQEGINLFAQDAGPEGGHGTFHSMIVWNNVADVKLDDRSTIAFQFSDVGGGTWAGQGNISMAPRFMAPAAGNFSLAPGSPCIGTGRNGTDMGAIPFEGGGRVFLRGDVDSSGDVNISDPIATLNHLFSSGTVGDCQDSLDANDDGAVNITDPIYVLQFLFQGGPQIKLPWPDPGVDPTEDSLSC
jgi:hypothetical protein